MDPQVVQQWFQQIQQIWTPCAGGRRIIPFCTPVRRNPPALVIGINHAAFVDRGGSQSDQIATRFAERVPTESTFVTHTHKFARSLHSVCGRAGIVVDETWVGTNRCAVQTRQPGLGEIEGEEGFSQCQQQMDYVLWEIINVIEPCNVLLVGGYAMRLFYPSETVGEAQDLDHELPSGRLVSIIPLPHFSYPVHQKIAAERMEKWFIR